MLVRRGARVYYPLCPEGHENRPKSVILLRSHESISDSGQERNESMQRRSSSESVDFDAPLFLGNLKFREHSCVFV